MTKLIFDKFIISNPEIVGSAVRVFVAPHHQNFKEQIGQLFIVVQTGPNKIYPTREDVEKTINFIDAFISFVEKKYYQQAADEALEKHFEKILQETNQWLKNNFYATELGSNLFNTSIIILKDSTIFFASIGEIIVKLIQEKEITDLTGSETRTSQFSQIVSGILNPQDTLFFSTNNFFDYFSLEKTRDVLTKNKPLTASKFFLNSLKEQMERLSIAGLIIKNEEGITSPPPQIEKPKPEKTKQIKKIKQPKSLETKIQVEKKEIVLPQELLIEKKDLATLEKPQRRNLIAKIISLLIIRPLKKIFRSINTSLIKYFNKLSLVEHFLVGLSIILAIVFLAGLINLNKKTQNQESLQRYQTTISEVQTKINELKASLIYNDTKKAKELVVSIEMLLENLPQKTKTEKQMFQSLNQTFNEQVDKLYKRVNLKEIKILVDLLKVNPKIALSSLVFDESGLYSFDQSSNEIYKINREKGLLEKFYQLPAGTIPYFKILSLDKDTLFLLKRNGEACLLSVTLKKHFLANIESSRKNRNIDEAVIYAGRFYALEKNTNQIYKYTKTFSGFGKEENWFKDKVDLKNAVSFAADGSLYILENNGKISKFYKGKQTSFTLEEIWPQLEMPVKILTRLEAKNLYILEPTNKRIIIFDKNGKLIKQIYSDEFSDLKDFAVNEKETKAWLLNDHWVIEIEL